MILQDAVPRAMIQQEIAVFLLDQFSKIREEHNIVPPSTNPPGLMIGQAKEFSMCWLIWRSHCLLLPLPRADLGRERKIGDLRPVYGYLAHTLGCSLLWSGCRPLLLQVYV
jgi:hypothetical protein